MHDWHVEAGNALFILKSCLLQMSAKTRGMLIPVSVTTDLDLFELTVHTTVDVFHLYHVQEAAWLNDKSHRADLFKSKFV